MTATHRVVVDGGWRDLPVASMGGEALVVPNVAGLVRRADGSILLQRRDKPGEDVRGRFEIPVGKWRAGETAFGAVVREVREETGLDVTVVGPPGRRGEAHPGRPFEEVQPLATVVGVGGAYPALVLVFACEGAGTPRPLAGETADPAWYRPEEVAELLTDPSRFTGPAALALEIVLGR